MVNSSQLRDGPESDCLSELLEGARGGCHHALGELLQGCRQYLLLTANRLLDPHLRAKLGPSDVVQETLHDAHRDFDRFHGVSEDDLLAWLRHILLNNLADVGRRYRAAKRQVAREVSWQGIVYEEPRTVEKDSPQANAISHEQHTALMRALDHLSGPARDVIQWRNYERCSFEEIGRRLGRSAEAARKVWVRALEQLHHHLEPSDESW